MDSAIARQWIVANVIPLCIGAGWGIASYALRQWVASHNPGMAFGALLSYAVAEFVMSVLVYGAFGKLTAPVLRARVPAMSQRAWLFAHIAVGALIGLVSAPYVYVVALGQHRLNYGASLWDDLDAGTVALLPAAIALFGFLFGMLLGIAQAAVLKRVAEGLRTWIFLSAIGTAVSLVIMAIGIPFQPSRETFAGELISEMMYLIGGIAGAIVMLAALRRLRPVQVGAH